MLAATLAGQGHAQSTSVARPVRNDVPQEGTELLVLRHQKFHKGGHEAYFQLSRDGVWPWYEKIGSRIVGQWKVIHPDGSPEDPDFDHGYRLARYASYEHWQRTRGGAQPPLGGDGPDHARSREALRARGHFSAGSDGAHFLEGATASTRPYFMPVIDETYERAENPPPDGPRPARNDLNWPAREIVALDRWIVEKGATDSLIQAGERDVWPYLEKVGARVIGLWKAVHYEGSGFPASRFHDELFLMVRYAGYEHWKAARPGAIVRMGGDGNDYAAYKRTIHLLESKMRVHTLTFLEGHLYGSPPKFLPGLEETYRKVR